MNQMDLLPLSFRLLLKVKYCGKMWLMWSKLLLQTWARIVLGRIWVETSK